MAYYFLRNPDLLLDSKLRRTPLATQNSIKLANHQFLIQDYLIRKIKRTPLREIKIISLSIPNNWTPNSDPILLKSTSDLSDWILADLEKSQKNLPLKNWLDDIYRVYTDGPAISHASGLLRYRFKAQSPYGSIELFTDSLQNPTLFIRCELQSSTLGARYCQRTSNVTPQIQINYRFTRLNLKNWRTIHQTIEHLIKTIHRSKPS